LAQLFRARVLVHEVYRALELAERRLRVKVSITTGSRSPKPSLPLKITATRTQGKKRGAAPAKFRESWNLRYDFGPLNKAMLPVPRKSLFIFFKNLSRYYY
jgi:hypothetical protein